MFQRMTSSASRRNSLKLGNTPDIGRNTVIAFQHIGCCDDFAQDSAGTQQLHAAVEYLAWLPPSRNRYMPFNMPSSRLFRHFGMWVVFVHHGDVVKDVFLFLVHTAQAILNDHRQLIRKRGIVGDAIRNGGRPDGYARPRAAVLLRSASCARPCRPAGIRGAHVSGRPGQIADTLKAKHGIENIERDHLHVVVAV